MLVFLLPGEDFDNWHIVLCTSATLSPWQLRPRPLLTSLRRRPAAINAAGRRLMVLTCQASFPHPTSISEPGIGLVGSDAAAADAVYNFAIAPLQ